MKEGYIPKEQRKNILLLTDDIRFPSGVGHIGREIVLNSSHHYNWVNLGGAQKHPEEGKRIDISGDGNQLHGIEDASIIIQPNSGYGDIDKVRRLLKEFNIDAIFLITDPRYFTWLFQFEHEIRKTTPIVYLNIWDDYPAPAYNSAFYESCDALFGISKQTVNINKIILGDKAEGKIIKYVPHGLNHNTFHPITKDSPNYKEFTNFKNQMFKTDPEFVLFYNSRNIRRKQVGDTLLAWKYFIDKLPKEKQDKVKFVLHTEIVSEHGTDLMAIKDYLLGSDYENIVFSTGKISPVQLNYLYNMADAQILLTSNEGWGLSLTEATLAGTPIIANVTGGMQDQMRFVDNKGNWFTPSPKIPSNHTGKYKKHGEWAFPVFPTNRSLQGSPQTPYIWDDRCRPEDAVIQIEKLYNMSREERKALGLKGREWAIGDEAGFTAEIMTQRVIEGVDQTFEEFIPRKKYEFINANEFKKPTVQHSLIY